MRLAATSAARRVFPDPGLEAAVDRALAEAIGRPAHDLEAVVLHQGARRRPEAAWLSTISTRPAPGALNSVAFALTWATMALMLAATAAVVLRTGVLARWLGWSGLAIAVALLASVRFFTADPPTLLLARLWMIAVSVVLIGRGDTPSVADSTHAGAPQPMAASAG